MAFVASEHPTDWKTILYLSVPTPHESLTYSSSTNIRIHLRFDFQVWHLSRSAYMNNQYESRIFTPIFCLFTLSVFEVLQSGFLMFLVQPVLLAFFFGVF